MLKVDSVQVNDRVESTPKVKEIEKLFLATAKHNASDLHLKPGMRPVLRIATVLHEIGNTVFTKEQVKKLVYEIMTEKQIAEFERTLNIDFAYSIEGVGRWRIDVFQERGNIALAARRVNTYIPTFEELHLPPGIKRIPTFTQGLVILAGVTGSGKSTTIASILEHINQNRKCHIVTIEDPIEYLFTDKKAFINQREIGIDVENWAVALKHVVRQDPDVIFIGEMRDRMSFEAGLLAAETGHLVLGTVHASSAAGTLGRILDLFETERQPLIREQLAFNLKAIVCQKLLPSIKPGVRMVPAVELMFVNPMIEKLIRTGEDHLIADVIRGSEEEGMQDMNTSLKKLIDAGLVSRKVAIAFSPNPEHLKMLLSGIIIGDEHKIIG